MGDVCPPLRKSKNRLDMVKWAAYKECLDPARKNKLLGELVEENIRLVHRYCSGILRRLLGSFGVRPGPAFDSAQARVRKQAPQGRAFHAVTDSNEEPLYQDYLQAGRLGLMYALEHFNPDMGAFAVYAKTRIRHEIQQYEDQAAPFHIPKSAHLDFKVFKKAEAIRSQEGRDPTAEELGISQAELSAWLQQPRISDSKFAAEFDPFTICGNGDRESVGHAFTAYTQIIDYYADESPRFDQQIEQADEHAALHEAIAQISDEITRAVIKAHFFEGKGLDNVAKVLNISKHEAKSRRDDGVKELRRLMADG